MKKNSLICLCLILCIVQTSQSGQEAGNGKSNASFPTDDVIKDRAAQVRAFTGSSTRVVWCQSVEGPEDYCATGKTTKLLGYSTEDGKGERVILSDVTSYAKPIFTPDGNRVVYSDRSNNTMYVVNWDGSGHQEIGNGYASDLWRDPSDGKVWLYYRGGNGGKDGGVMRKQLDNPKESEKVWDQTPTGHEIVPWFRLSVDGAYAASAFPWRSCGVADLANNNWEQYGGGCWPSIAPDNSYMYFHFFGSHKEIGFYDIGKKNYRVIKVGGGPGVDGNQVYHPRWSNNVRFLTVTGPKQSDKQEVLLGQFNQDFTKVEKWVQITHNDKADFYGDVWIESGYLTKLNQKSDGADVQKQSEPKGTQDFSKFTKWPGDQSNLIFLWKNNNSNNQIQLTDNKPGRLCQAVARDRAVFGRFYEMDLGGGAVLAQNVDDALLEACKRSNELTIEATITPDNITQDGLARIISFSKDSGSRNFTLGQEKDTLVLELRTGLKGENQKHKICKIKAGQTVHLVAMYKSGQLTCFANGKQVLKTDRVKGNFSKWEPMHLLFGDEWDGGHDWKGHLEGVAIYARAASTAEVLHKHKLFAARLSERKQIERLVIQGKLTEITTTPTEKDLGVYSRGLVVYSYEVLKVLEGKEQAKKIQVAHWAVLDRKKVPEICQRKEGQVHKLLLENFDEHPQLQSERTFNECEDFDIPLYYDVADRGVTESPVVTTGNATK